MTRWPPARLVLLALLLVAAAPVRADGIELTGEVSMGLVGGSGQPEGSAARLMTDLDLQLRLSRTTDNGLTFALEIDLDDIDTQASTTAPDIPRRR